MRDCCWHKVYASSGYQGWAAYGLAWWWRMLTIAKLSRRSIDYYDRTGRAAGDRLEMRSGPTAGWGILLRTRHARAGVAMRGRRARGRAVSRSRRWSRHTSLAYHIVAGKWSIRIGGNRFRLRSITENSDHRVPSRGRGRIQSVENGEYRLSKTASRSCRKRRLVSCSTIEHASSMPSCPGPGAAACR